jgi:SAM-dependent methyltransferase
VSLGVLLFRDGPEPSQSLRSRLGNLVRKARRRLHSGGTPRSLLILDSRVETRGQRRILGSITVPAGTGPVPVELSLNDIPVAKAWATVAADHDRRGNEVRTFAFALREIWRFARVQDRLIVKADDAPLPFDRTGRRYLAPKTSGPRTPARLRQRMAEGYVFDQYGKLRLSKTVDTEWQRSVVGLFGEVRSLLKERFDRDLFFIYGTLLGAVREGGFIGHDIDLDTAFLCSATDGAAAAAELRELAFALIDAGYVVDPYRTHLHVTDAAGTRIDVFHVYFDAAGNLCLPFGYAGTTTITRSDWQGVREIDFPGGRGVIPVNGEQFVEHLYGRDWRQPKPGFHWPHDRTGRADEGVLPLEMHEEIYWANFYAHTHYDSGSTFFDFVSGRPDTPPSVIDIGCGDGRDSFAFGSTGRTVLGLDRSHIAVRHAGKKAESLGLHDRVRFRGVDVSETGALRATLDEVIGASPDAPVLFYLRFFLHSIPEEVQEGLLDVIDACARPGDVLAAEFRTDQDQTRSKVHHKHYRRYQNGPAFGATLRERYSFALLHEEEGTGLSPYKGEDPVLYRVVARRNDG